ncbi:hypothetical protein AB0O91_00210 [Kitasatospora sp. NPDC089797]|uniref:hypothetical protein n=1 Tax=Kitasatospora sp. NPDC089797 TaxID=3155298 RepID=UPI00342464EE
MNTAVLVLLGSSSGAVVSHLLSVFLKLLAEHRSIARHRERVIVTNLAIRLRAGKHTQDMGSLGRWN